MSNNPIKKPRLFVPIFKLTIVPLLLAYLIFDFIKQSSLTTLNLNIWIIVAALIVNQIGLMLFAIRMHLILHIFNINISYFQSLRIHLQSMFYFFVLPMTVGMEAARYVKINNIEGVKSRGVDTISALLMDRLVGAIAALLLSLILWPFVEFKLEYNVSYPKNSLYVIIIVILLFIYLLKNRLYNFILKIIKLLTNHILGFIRATIVSIGTHLFFSLSVFLAVKGAHIDISLLQSVFVVSASMLFILIPVSFAGISAVDVASVAVLTGCGIKIEDAIIFALFSYVAKLLAAIQGGVWEIYEGGGDFTKSLANANVINLKR